MASPLFLEFDELLRIHMSLADRYGGSSAIHDAGLLISAVATPHATFERQFLHADLFDMAGAYLYHIIQNHPFVNANERTGAMAAIVFLDLNGYRVVGSDEDLLALIADIKSGAADKTRAGEFFRNNSKPRTPSASGDRDAATDDGLAPD